jgi:hypothetical protein
MSKTKEIDILTKDIASQIDHKLYKLVSDELAYSDIDLEGDELNNLHSEIMKNVVLRLQTKYEGW